MRKVLLRVLNNSLIKFNKMVFNHHTCSNRKDWLRDLSLKTNDHIRKEEHKWKHPNCNKIKKQSNSKRRSFIRFMGRNLVISRVFKLIRMWSLCQQSVLAMMKLSLMRRRRTIIRKKMNYRLRELKSHLKDCNQPRVVNKQKISFNNLFNFLKLNNKNGFSK